MKEGGRQSFHAAGAAVRLLWQGPKKMAGRDRAVAGKVGEGEGNPLPDAAR